MQYLDMTRVTAFKTTEQPLARSRSGYGSKLPDDAMLQLDGKRWHRVYSVCWSNSSTSYVLVKGVPHYLQTGWRHPFDVRQCQTVLIADRLKYPNGR